MERFTETWKRKGQDESDTGDKNKVEGLVKKWLVFFEKNLNKVANLDQKTSKNNTRKGKLGNDSINSLLYKINKSKLRKVKQSKPSNNSRLRSWLCCCKDSKVVYFKWTVYFKRLYWIFFFSWQENSFIKFCSTSLAKYCK